MRSGWRSGWRSATSTTARSTCDGLLEQAVAELATAVAELRQIAHGLRPSCLDDGLGRRWPRLTADPDPGRARHRADERARRRRDHGVLRGQRGVTNAVKHAGPRRIALRVAPLTGRSPSGSATTAAAAPRRGPARARRAVDRVAAAGGDAALDSPAGRGTVIEAVLPCAS